MLTKLFLRAGNFLGELFLIAPQQVDPAYPSIEPTLSLIVGKSVYEKIKLAASSLKQVVSECARTKNCTEDELIRIIAHRLGLGFVEKPFVVDLRSLPASMTLSLLKEHSAIPLTSQGAVIGMVCLDPASLGKFKDDYAGSNLYLGSWQTIEKSLEASVKKFEEEEETIKIHNKTKILHLAESVLGEIVSEARQHGAEHLQINLLDESAEYSFIAQNGKKWNGTIDEKIRDSLVEYLSCRAAVGSNACTIPDLQCLEIEALGGIFTIRIGTSIAGARRKIDKGSGSLVLVDDSETFRKVLELFLGREGYHVVPFKTCEESLEYLKSLPSLPIAIVTDLHVGEMSGLALLKNIKSIQQYSAVPVIVLTSDEEMDTEIQILRAGATAFCSKAKDPNILKMQLERAIAGGVN